MAVMITSFCLPTVVSLADAEPLMPYLMPDESIQSIISDLQQRYPEYPQTAVVIVRVSEQKLYLMRNGMLENIYSISTSKYGIGNKDGSFQTPLGIHQVLEKIGADAPAGTIFESRNKTQQIADIIHEPVSTPFDYVTTRIIWLDGLEPGINKGGDIDSHVRYIYIHGTHEEGLLGQPASKGCVRMRNEDVIELFDKLPRYSLVMIAE